MTTGISKGSLDGIMTQVSINVKPDIIAEIDEKRGTQSRSSYIVDCVRERLSGGDADKKQLFEQTIMYKNEVEFLRLELTKMTDAVAQKLLSEPKKPFWSRVFRRNV
jgi:metal-responsive CopG/Arc/MetJ family transcriptional regulator